MRMRRLGMLLGSLLGLVVVLACAGAVPALAFDDVPADHPYVSAIDELSTQGVVGGYGNGAFGLDDPVLRQQFAKMIVISLGLPVSEDDLSPFADVTAGGPDSFYPDNYVAVAAAQGIIRGSNEGTARVFRPWESTTRGQMITMVVRAADQVFPGLLDDAPAGFGSLGTKGAEQSLAAGKAEYNQLLAGLIDFGSGWDYWTPATRGEVAQVLWRLRRLASREGTTFTPQQIYDDFNDNERLDGVYTRAELRAFLVDPGLLATGPARAFRLALSLVQDHPRIGRVVFDGDSLTAGSNAHNPYPSQLMAAWPRSIPWVNLGIGGQPLMHMVNNAPQNVDPLYHDGEGQEVVVIWGGTNDIALWNHTSDEVYLDLVQYAEERHQRGFRVVVLTMLPRSDSYAQPDFEARRQHFNDKVRAGWESFADLLVDVANDQRIGAPGAEENLAYYTSDRVHISDAGHGVVASLVRDGLNKLDRWTGLPQ